MVLWSRPGETGTYRQTGDAHTEGGHIDRRGTHRQTGDTQTDGGHTYRCSSTYLKSVIMVDRDRPVVILHRQGIVGGV
jgi:hypothetical protein